jgi:penicillin-binding protein 2
MMANGGTLWRPRIVHEASRDGRAVAVTNARADSISRHFEFDPNAVRRVQESMEAVVYDAHGTGGMSKVEGVRVAGKTGTAQNPHGEDHALYICYAPADAPEIALAVLLENAGHGGSEAAPVARRVLEAYFHPAAAESARVAAMAAAAAPAARAPAPGRG